MMSLVDLIDAGLEELELDKEFITVYSDYLDFNNMQVKLESLNIEIQKSELLRIPNDFKTLNAKEAEKVIKLLDLLEENDDVQQVFHNMRLTDEILIAMENNYECTNTRQWRSRARNCMENCTKQFLQ